MKAGRAAIGRAEALETTMRLAVLLGAGLTPARAWAVVAEQGGCYGGGRGAGGRELRRCRRVRRKDLGYALSSGMRATQSHALDA